MHIISLLTLFSFFVYSEQKTDICNSLRRTNAEDIGTFTSNSQSRGGKFTRSFTHVFFKRRKSCSFWDYRWKNWFATNRQVSNLFQLFIVLQVNSVVTNINHNFRTQFSYRWLVDNSAATTPVSCIDTYDMTGDGIPNLIIGRQDGSIEVFTINTTDEAEVPSLIYNYVRKIIHTFIFKKTA